MLVRRRQTRRSIRTTICGLASITLAVGTVVVASPASAGNQEPEAEPAHTAEIDEQLQEELADGGSTVFWVYLDEKADLNAASSITDRAEQGRYVYEELTETAQSSQAGLLEMLKDAGADYQSFWISNTVKVTGDEGLLNQIAARPEVAQILPDRTYAIPEPTPAEVEQQINAVEWNIDRINAPRVWGEFGVTGENIVVANMDTGVQYDHSALVNQYRGNLGGGQFDHNYNWFDPSQVCGSPSLAPCDNNGHGTHTMGTIVGDDGAANQIGVAPGAKWIAAKGCESNFCSTGALLASFQWFLAPTDLQGQNADPARRPHVVNNSWGNDNGSDPTYHDSVRAWVAAGIFPVFSNGNNGFAGCQSVGVPASYPESYGVGAFDRNNNIAGFSSRGQSPIDGGIKPNVSAPGVAVRSSFPGNGYGALDGTSMAAPHVTGTIALMWSAATSLEGDIDGTRALIGSTAIDVENLQCGGTPENNNVWGEGRLDAFAATDEAPRGPVGTLSGTVTDTATGDPISGATITMTGPVERERTTGDDGTYGITLPVGDYTVTAAAFGYQGQSAELTITENQATTQDFTLALAPNATITGQVTDGSGHGWPLYTRVDVQGTPVNTYTDPVTGEYSLTLPTGATYTLQFSSQYPGYANATRTVDLSLPTTVDAELVVNRCDVAPGYDPAAGGGCSVVEGGLVVGNVTDQNTTSALNGATVARDANPADSGQSAATPEDPALDDGFYWLFSSATGSHRFTASADDYQPRSRSVNVAADGVTDADFALGAGRLTVTPTEVAHQLRLGQTGERTLTIRNTGTAPATVELAERRGDFVIQGGGHYQLKGSGAPARELAPVDKEKFTAPVEAGPASVRSPEAGMGLSDSATPAAPDWQSGAPLPAGLVRYAYAQCEDEPDVFYVIAGVSDGLIVDGNYRYDASTNTWTTLAPIPAGQEGPTAACLDGRIYVMGGGGSNQHFVYDIATDTWGSAAPVPRGIEAAAAGVFEGQVFLAGGDNDFTPGNGVYDEVDIYDAASDSWSSGSPMPVGTSNPGAVQVGELLYLAGGWGQSSPGSNVDATQVYDMSSDTWEAGPEFPIAKSDFALAATGAALYAIGGDADGSGFFDSSASVHRLDLGDWPGGTWEDLEDPLPAPLTANQAGFCTSAITGGETWSVGGIDGSFSWRRDAFYRESGEGCGGAVVDVPWLSVNPPTLTIAPGRQVRVTVGFDANVEQPGTYTAGIRITHDTPYDVPSVGVTMTVTPPTTWGKITGTVSGVDCRGNTGPLEGAIVHLDGLQFDTTLLTDEAGGYAYWVGSSNNPLRLTAATGEHIPQTRQTRIVPRQTIVENFTLRQFCRSGSEGDRALT